MIPPRRKLTTDELYWHTLAIGITALVINTVENDLPLYRLDIRFLPSSEAIRPWTAAASEKAQRLVRRFRREQFSNRVCCSIERRVCRYVEAAAVHLPRPAPQAIEFVRNGVRLITLEVPRVDERLDVKSFFE